MEILYFTAGAVSLMVGIIIQPYLQELGRNIKSFFTRKNTQPNVYCDDLQSQIDELKEQMDNVAKNSYRREQNRKSNIRREVRDYLAELRTKK